MPDTVSIAPTGYPITVIEAKAHIQLDDDIIDQDALIEADIAAAVDLAELMTNRQFMPATRVYRCDRFPGSAGVIRLPRAPVQSIASITYVDTAGATQTLASSGYDLDAFSSPARVAPSYGNTWPATRLEMNAVAITYVAGYGGRDHVPEAIRQALKITVEDFFRERGSTSVGAPPAELPTAAQRLLRQFWVPLVA